MLLDSNKKKVYPLNFGLNQLPVTLNNFSQECGKSLGSQLDGHNCLLDF